MDNELIFKEKIKEELMLPFLKGKQKKMMSLKKSMKNKSGKLTMSDCTGT